MKKTFYFLLILNCLTVFGQENLSTEKERIFISDSLTGESGEFYMEGKHIDINKLILSPYNIAEMKTFYGKIPKTHGAHLIIRKSKKPILGLSEFIAKFKSENGLLKDTEKIIVTIDNLLINNLTEYQIELDCIVEVRILIDKNYPDRNERIPCISIITNRIREE